MPKNQPRFLLCLIAGLLACWAAVFHDTFSYDWFNDDYHLIRSYSAAELTSTWAGAWDIDGLETPGYRPGLTLFHHLRAALGESILAHHLFQLILMGTLLFILGNLFFKLGLDRPSVGCVYVLLFASKTFATHMVYLAEGGMLTTCILIASASLAALTYIDTGKARHQVWAVLFAAAAILTKEDAYLLAPLLAALCGLQPEKRSARRRLFGPAGNMVLMIAVLTLAHYTLRSILIQDAPAILSAQEALKSYLSQVRLAVFNFGDISLPYYDEGGFQTASRLTKHIATVQVFVLGSVAGMFLSQGVPASETPVPRLIICGLISSLPGLVVSRSDLVLLPTAFFLAALVVALMETGRAVFSGGFRWDARTGFFVSITAGYCLLIPGGVLRSIGQTEDFHPRSVNKVLLEVENAYGRWSFVPVPAERRAKLIETLRSHNIRSYQDGRALAADVSKNWPVYAANQGSKTSIFVPHFSFMEP